MTSCRIRVSRETPVSGAFEWATFDARGALLDAGAGNLENSPVTGACDVVLASDLCLIDRIAVPAQQQRRVGAALRYLAEEISLAEPERLHVAAAAGPDRNSLCVAVVDRSWLEALLPRLRAARLSPQSAYPESLLPALAPRCWTVVWRSGEGFVRTGENEAATLDATEGGSLPAALRLAVDQARSRGIPPQAITVRCLPSVAMPDLAVWTEALGVPVEEGPAWHWTAAARRPGIEILQGEFAAGSGASPWTQRLRRSAVLGAVLLGLTCLAVALDWGLKVRERSVLVAEMRALYRETFGEKAVVVDPPLQMSRALAELRRQSGRTEPGDFLALLGVAADLLPAHARRSVAGMAYENRTLTVTLRPPDGPAAAELLNDLRARAPAPRHALEIEQSPAGSLTLRLRAGAAP